MMGTQQRQLSFKLRAVACTAVCLFAVGCKPATTPNAGPGATTGSPTVAEITPESTNSGEVSEQTAITIVPVKSSELDGIWYGTEGDLGVLVRFVGRQSREPDQRGVLGGDCQVFVKGSSIGFHVSYTDDPETGTVHLTSDLVNAASKEQFTKEIGFVERGDDNRLYFTVMSDAEEERYPAAERLPLTFIENRGQIQPSDLETLRDAMTNSESNAGD